MNGRLSPARTFAPRCTWRSPTSDDRPCPLYSGFPKWRQAIWRRRTVTDAGSETEVLRLVAHPGWKFARLSAGGEWIRTLRPARDQPRCLDLIAGAHILAADADRPVINSAGGIRGSRERGARSTPPLGRIRRRTRCRRRVPVTGAPFRRSYERPPRRECASDRP